MCDDKVNKCKSRLMNLCNGLEMQKKMIRVGAYNRVGRVGETQFIFRPYLKFCNLILKILWYMNFTRAGLFFDMVKLQERSNEIMRTCSSKTLSFNSKMTVLQRSY